MQEAQGHGTLSLIWGCFLNGQAHGQRISLPPVANGHQEFTKAISVGFWHVQIDCQGPVRLGYLPKLERRYQAFCGVCLAMSGLIPFHRDRYPPDPSGWLHHASNGNLGDAAGAAAAQIWAKKSQISRDRRRRRVKKRIQPGEKNVSDSSTLQEVSLSISSSNYTTRAFCLL